jgi:hypothetical protein
MIAWTIYDHPSDFPDCYVARKFALDKGAEPVPQREVMTSPTLDAIRGQLAAIGLMRFPRNAGDDPKIVETWL